MKWYTNRSNTGRKGIGRSTGSGLCAIVFTQSPTMNQIDLFPKLVATQPDDFRSWAQTLKIMRVMAQMEPTPTALLEVLLHLLPLKTDHLKYFRGPIIVSASRWSDLLPAWLLQAVRQERFLLILDEFEQGIVTEAITPAEIVCTLQPLTLEAPLRREYAELCLWAFDQVMQRHNCLPEGHASFFAMTGGQPVQPIQHVLQEVSVIIRRKVVRHAPKVERALAQPFHGKVTSPEVAIKSTAQDITQPEQVMQVDLFQGASSTKL
jgi:hypothetical protein